MGQWKHVFYFRVSCGLKVDVIVSFSCIAVTVTAQLYQRSRLLLETHWKEEHCDISRYVLIMSLSPCACTVFLSFTWVVCVWAAVVPLPPGRAADAHLPGPGAGSPGLQDPSEAADGGAERPERAEAATGGAADQGGHRAPQLGAEGRALSMPAQRGPETGEETEWAAAPLQIRLSQQRLTVFAALQANQSKQEQRQEEAAERRLRKASKEVLQMRGQSQKEPLPVQTFRWEMHWSVFTLLVTATKSKDAYPGKLLCLSAEAALQVKLMWYISQLKSVSAVCYEHPLTPEEVLNLAWHLFLPRVLKKDIVEEDCCLET